MKFIFILVHIGDPTLTGDRSRKLSLPTVVGSGRSSKELSNIDCHTMADLLRGKYDDKVASYRIIDARYCLEQSQYLTIRENNNSI